MPSAFLNSTSASVAPHPRRASTESAPSRTDTWVYLAITALVLSAWAITAQGWFTSWSRTGYWLGVAGGVAMLLLFTYPLRKRWSVTYRWGAAKHWFVAHMVLGVLGPWLILLHSTFSVRSTNAAVALYAMIAVALSGVMGRFLYVRLNSDLRGERASLAGLRQAMTDAHRRADSELAALPRVLEALHTFEADCLHPDRASGRTHLRLLLTLSWRRRQVEARCKALLKENIAALAKEQQWSKAQAMAQYSELRWAILQYTASAQRAAQFQTLERLFSLWHIAHVPFVWVLVVCALFHVVAVHAY